MEREVVEREDISKMLPLIEIGAKFVNFGIVNVRLAGKEKCPFMLKKILLCKRGCYFLDSAYYIYKWT